MKFAVFKTDKAVSEDLNEEEHGQSENEEFEFFGRVIPVDTGRKLNVHKTFRRRPGRLLNILCTFNLRQVSTGIFPFCYKHCLSYFSIYEPCLSNIILSQFFFRGLLYQK